MSVVLALVIASVLAISSSAAAASVVGQTAPGPFFGSSCEFEFPYDEVQAGVEGGASYTVPTAGVLTSWSTNEGPGGGPLGLKVFRPFGGGYLVVGADGPRSLTRNALNTFPINIPVQAGDILGVAVPANSPSSCEFFTTAPGDRISYQEGSRGVGQVMTPEETFGEARLNVSAVLLPPPAIGAITPAQGSIQGGNVVITGFNFANVTGVSFGAVPAAFAVNSEGQITAIAPPSATLASVPVTVSTVAGTATAPQLFTYEGCRVPQLRGKRLKAAKKKIRAADCSVGKVKKLEDATAKTGKVAKQNPKPGRILAPGTKVKVVLQEA
jgi:hypothetical protein